jgi:hypothetical protein
LVASHHNMIDESNKNVCLNVMNKQFMCKTYKIGSLLTFKSKLNKLWYI